MSPTIEGAWLGFWLASGVWLFATARGQGRSDRQIERLRQELRTADAARDALALALHRERAKWTRPSRLPTDPMAIRAEIDALTSRATVFDDLEDEPGSYGV